MVSDQEIASCVESLLRQQSADPANAGAAVSLAGVVQQVEAKLGLDLSHKAAFIRDQIDLLLGPPRPPAPAAPPHFIFQAPHQLLFQPFHQIPGNASSPFAHLGTHHELAFRYPPPLAGGAAAAAAVAQQFHHQQQQQQMVQVALPGARPIGSNAPVKESAPTGVKRRGGPGGLSKVCGVSPELQAIVGEPAMPRTQIVKQLWAYIRKNNLQDPNNKRKIICNDELRVVFETDCTDMFKMNKLLAKHIIPLDPTKEGGPASKKLKAEDVVAASETDADQKPLDISDALAHFFGTGEKEMLQSEALKRILDYIKDNQLEDPTNTTLIHCDPKLQQLFGCEKLSTLAIPEMLTCHLSKKS